MKLYRLRYSPYARKVQMVLELLGTEVDVVDVPFGDRTELASVTGGYVMVPVLVDEDGTVIVDSRRICERLLAGKQGEGLVPSPLEGPIWAYADFIDGPLEDILFRIAAPAVRDAWATPLERGLYVFSKERKFGAGCVDAWERERDVLVKRAAHLLGPTLVTLEKRPFLFGDMPTLADAALYGNCVMLEECVPAAFAQISPKLAPFMRRLEASRRRISVTA